MDNETSKKATWQKPEMIDLDIELTDKIYSNPEDGPNWGPY